MTHARPVEHTSDASSSRAPERLTPRESVIRGLKLLGIQLGILVLLSVVFAVLDLDRTIAGCFYRPGEKWFLGHHPMWKVLYLYGTLPGALLAIVCLLAWLASFFNRRLRDWRPYLLLVVLTTVIAAGLLVNTVLKQYWGRPRPNQITEFGGHYTYRHLFPPGIPGKGASFPSGHAVMGFSFVTLYFLRRRSRTIASAGVSTGLILGGLLSAARLVKGAHFPTDVIWSLGIVVMTATALYYCIQKIPAGHIQRPALVMGKGKKIILIGAVAMAVTLIGGAFMTRRPFYKTVPFEHSLGSVVDGVRIRLNVEPEEVTVTYGNQDKVVVLVHAHGFGWAWVDYDIRARFTTRATMATVTLEIDARSYFAELDHTLEVTLPARLKDHMIVEVVPN
jgi:lipid A 4'-phosphatase